LQDDVFTPIVATRDLFDDPFRTETIAEQCCNLTFAKNQAQSIDSIYRTYAPGLNSDFDKQFKERFSKINSEWQTLKNLVADINKDPTQTYQIHPIESLSYGSPILKILINPVTPYWGGDGGGPFQDITYRSVLNHTRISQIVMHGGALVDKIEVTYTSDTGTTTVSHGGGGGSPSSPFNLQASETIVQISGTANNIVCQLAFKTNYDQYFVWPPKPEGASAFPTWNKGSNEIMIGFQGRSGEYLDQLQPLICTFKDAVWEK